MTRTLLTMHEGFYTKFSTDESRGPRISERERQDETSKIQELKYVSGTSLFQGLFSPKTSLCLRI